MRLSTDGSDEAGALFWGVLGFLGLGFTAPVGLHRRAGLPMTFATEQTGAHRGKPSRKKLGNFLQDNLVFLKIGVSPTQ